MGLDVLLTSVPWAGLGWGAIILIAVREVFKGDIVPGKTHREALAQRDEVIRRERHMADRLMSALQLLATEHGTTTDKILSSLPLVEGGDDE